MKSRDSRDVLSVFRLRKRYNIKQTKFSLKNKATLPWIGNTKINVPIKVLQALHHAPYCTYIKCHNSVKNEIKGGCISLSLNKGA